MIGQEQEPDDDLRDDQRLSQSEPVRDQHAAAAPWPAIRDEREHGGNQTDSDYEECQRVMHR
jgi:hypothetical protein